MEYGKWELRTDSRYWFSKDAWIYPSANAVDSGKLHAESNVRNIYRDLSTKNFALRYNYFKLTVNPGRTAVIVNPGEGIVQGYHFYAKNTIEVPLPVTNNYQQWTLGISLSYDAANQVTGDVLNRDLPVGESEILSGVYIKWFDACQLECWYDNILVLGRAWAKDGIIVPDGTIIDGREIYHGFEPDPFKDHRYEANLMELQIHGHKTTIYDTLRDNLTQIHTATYTYDSQHFPIELDRMLRTKPPTMLTDLQDYVNHIPDWYTSKYGDYMSGALRFNNLSIDAKREFLGLSIIKDDIDNTYADSVLISPRTYGDLVRLVSDSVEGNNDPLQPTNKGYDYNVGGTVLSIVPGTYPGTTDDNNGYIGISSGLLAQKFGESGLRIHSHDGNNSNRYGTTRLVHYNMNDDGQHYFKDNVQNHSENSSKFILENIDLEGRIASVNVKNGEIFIDSFVQPKSTNYSETIKGILTGTQFNGNYRGSGIQLYTGGPGTTAISNIDFRLDEYKISIAEHAYLNHRLASRGTNHSGATTDNLHFELGLGISYDTGISYDSVSTTYNEIQKYNISANDKIPGTGPYNRDMYMALDNIRIRSNTVTGATVKQNTIEVLNNNNCQLPYIRIKPRVYSEQYLAEQLIQVGTAKYDNYFGNDAQKNTLNRIVMKRVGVNAGDNTGNTAFTYIEQDYKHADGTTSGQSKVFTKIRPPKSNSNIQAITGATIEYDEIAGMYSAGNIGVSTAILNTARNADLTAENTTDKNNPYLDTAEWMRMTRFRYDNDKDQVNGGTYTGTHQSGKGRIWGDTYNLEFNTQVANRRANQIIWRYKGSLGAQNETSLNNTPPVVLSYIHDNTNETQGTPTKYTNVTTKGEFEEYIDHNGVTHYNPTCKIRDFLLLENAGLNISGDINNPSVPGDTLNTNNHLGVTIVNGRVYNSVYNDLAETYEKDDMNEYAHPGDIIELNPETGKYRVCKNESSKFVVGVQSNTYGYLLGGNRINNTQDILDNENEFFTVAISGKVWINVDDDTIEPGDILTSKGNTAMRAIYPNIGTIIGKALSVPKYYKKFDCNKVLMQVMLG